MRKKHTPYWFNVIRRAITRWNKGLRPFTERHKRIAFNFTTCACGKQDPRILRRMSNGVMVPIDARLYALGCTFYGDVGGEHPHHAMKTLLKIEKRAGEIIAEVEARR